jgi:hypothetical protein
MALASIGMAGCELGVEGSKVVAKMISVMPWLTYLWYMLRTQPPSVRTRTTTVGARRCEWMGWRGLRVETRWGAERCIYGGETSFRVTHTVHHTFKHLLLHALCFER